MSWHVTSTAGEPPRDPVGEAVAQSLAELLSGAAVELAYSPAGSPPPFVDADETTAMATAAGPEGWDLTLVVRLGERIGALLAGGSTSLAEILAALPGAGLEVADAFRPLHSLQGGRPLSPPVRRAVRDSLASEVLADYLRARLGGSMAEDLIPETVEFLIELSGSRVEAHDLTHGVVVADVIAEAPRLHFSYPADVRTAKRAPLLFDGKRALLLVDTQGRARTELQRHRLGRLGEPSHAANRAVDLVESGSVVAEATRVLGGVGFFLRADRSIWTFVDGQPLLVRRGEHWTAFPFELTQSVERMIGQGAAAELVVGAAFLISGQPEGAILAIVDDADDLHGIVPEKDRYDLRNEIDPTAMRTETRLHHLIDAADLDVQTVARLAGLDGATILDRDGRLLAYGAIVATSDSQHEGARTAAARTLSERALVVLKVSADGDITIFRKGKPITTLLGRTDLAL